MIDQKIGFIGAGRMATALARGVVHAGVASADQIVASDASSEALTLFESEVPGASTTDSNKRVAQEAGLLVLAVKPQVMTAVLDEIGDQVAVSTLVVSIAAGVKMSQLARALRRGARVVRVMPNTPCLIGQGASAYCLGEHATPEDAKLVDVLLTSVGHAFKVPEKQLDAVTGLSGSGPAFVYTAIEAMTDAGVQEGLPREVAAKLAAHTVCGAAGMVLSTKKHPAVLRDEVTSPGGTTAAGLAALERAGFRAALADAVSSAATRSRELGELG